MNKLYRVKVDNLVPGAILEGDILSAKQVLLLGAGRKLTPGFISLLGDWGISYVYTPSTQFPIDEEHQRSFTPHFDAIAQNREEVFYNAGLQFVLSDEERRVYISRVKERFGRISKKRAIEPGDITDLVEDLEQRKTNFSDKIIQMWHNVAQHDYLYNRALNGALLFNHLLEESDLDGSTRFEMTAAALLRDIGHAFFPPDLKNKRGPLTAGEFKLVQNHTKVASQLLTNSGFIGSDAVRAARGHHEKYDGSGYPDGLRGEEIPRSARLLAVCDTFDAIVSTRPYKNRMSPYEAIGEVCGLSGVHFDPAMTGRFVRCFGLYPPGTFAVLSSGDGGIVVKNNEGLPVRPVVRLLFSSDGTPVDKVALLDLSKETDLFVSEVFRA